MNFVPIGEVVDGGKFLLTKGSGEILHGAGATAGEGLTQDDMGEAKAYVDKESFEQADSPTSPRMKEGC